MSTDANLSHETYFLPDWSSPLTASDYAQVNTSGVWYQDELIRLIDSQEEYVFSLEVFCGWLEIEDRLRELDNFIRSHLTYTKHYATFPTGFADVIYMTTEGLRFLCGLKTEDPVFANFKSVYMDLEELMTLYRKDICFDQRRQIEQLTQQYRNLQRRYDAAIKTVSCYEEMTIDPQGPGIFYIATSKLLSAVKIGCSYDTSQRLTDAMLDAYGESVKLHIKVCSNPTLIEKLFYTKFRDQQIDRYLFHIDTFDLCTSFLDSQVDELFCTSKEYQ
jgi:hypothetical protein